MWEVGYPKGTKVGSVAGGVRVTYGATTGHECSNFVDCECGLVECPNCGMESSVHVSTRRVIGKEED